MASLIIVRGLPGSGKTTYAQSLTGRVLVEADHYRIDPETGEYRYRKSENTKVHTQCFEHVKELLKDGEDVTVANVFSLRWQVRQYYQLAVELGITDVTTVEMKARYKSHHADAAIIERLEREWQSGYGDQVAVEGVVTTIRRLTKNQIIFGLRLHSTGHVEDLGDDETNNSIGVAKVYVLADRKMLQMVPRVGDCWRISGTLRYDPFIVNKVVADACKRRLPTDGALLNSIIEDKERVSGIGKQSVLRVWKECKPNLQAVLDSGDPDGQLTDPKVGNLTLAKAVQLLDGWREHRTEFTTMKWLQANGLSSAITTKVYEFWGTEAITKLQENPYRLLSFFGWKTVDRFALGLGIPMDDPRRYAAAIEATCYKAYEEGSTAIRSAQLNTGIRERIGPDAPDFETQEPIWHDWLCYFVEDDLVQLAGIYAQEAFIERSISHRLTDPNIVDFARQKVTFDIKRLAEYELRKTNELRAAGVLGPNEYFELNDGQAEAIPFLLEHRLCCLTGGAGVGKTTVLEAVIDQLPHDATLIQMAPTGRAARVLSKATDRKAVTIARYVLDAHKKSAAGDAWVFVDEASMVCLADAHRLLKALPDSVRLIFIGDGGQLPPVGAGLIFHLMLAGDSIVPHHALTDVVRAAADTGIPQLSKAIREGINPGSGLLPLIRSEQEQMAQTQTQGCALIMTAYRQSTMDAALLEYRRMKGQTGESPQIIAASNAMCHSINVTLQAEHVMERQYHKKETQTIQVQAPKVLGQYQSITLEDPVLWHTRNDPSRDLNNGDLGIVTAIYPERKEVITEDGRRQYICMEVQFDDRLIQLDESDLNYLALGYAITGHKGQGSGWKHVVIAVEKTTWAGKTGIEVIDRSWIYTAVTRAKQQVRIVGDHGLFVDAALAPPLAERRLCGFHCRGTSPVEGVAA
ncbi:MAG: AAA family ATPase [Sedimenticola sp.]